METVMEMEMEIETGRERGRGQRGERKKKHFARARDVREASIAIRIWA